MKKHNDELDIEEDLTLEKRTWTIQRISWVLMFLIIVAALLGFTGNGGLTGISKITARTPSGKIELEYERFLRYEVTDKLKVKLNELDSSKTSIVLSRDFHEKLRVEQVVPEPETVHVNNNDITYTFKTNHPESQVMFYFRPTKIGSLTITATGPDKQAVTISHFVYP